MIRTRLAPGPYHVGQGIAVDVTIDRTIGSEQVGDPRIVDPPRIPLAELVAVDVDDTALTDPDCQVLGRFYLVPRRSGKLPIPPFRVRLGDRVASSKPSSITVTNVPTNGRSPAFLGGVGSFQVASRVDPGVVQVGQPVEVRFTMTGPAAVGSNLVPDVSAWSTLPPAFQVRESSSQLDRSDPPTRTFRYRLRPTKAGRTVLPPVPLSAFDPRSLGFTTRYTPSLALTVEDPPRFDPSRVDFEPPSSPDAPRRLLSGRIGVSLVIMLVGGMIVGSSLAWPAVSRRIERSKAVRPMDWRWEAARLSTLIPSGADRLDAAEVIAERFTKAIAQGARSPLAVLTPPEAEAAILAITDESELAYRVGRFVVRLDQVRFDPELKATAGDRERLVAEAVAIFEAIGRRSTRKRVD